MNIDLIIVGAFLLITLATGLYAGRGIKDIREYAIANKAYGTATIILTVSATYIGGSVLIGGVKNVFSDGIIVTAAALFSIIGLLFVSFFVAPRLACYKGMLTVGDLAESFFGPSARLIVGLIGLFNTTLLFSMQTLALGYVVGSLLGISDSTSIVWISGLILTSYAVLGGIRAVAVTDVLQLLVLITTISILAMELSHKAGGFINLLSEIPKEHFRIRSHPKFDYYLALATVGYLLPTTFLTPPFIQRMFMAKSADQARKTYLVLSAFLPSVRLLVMVIGLSALVVYPNKPASEISSWIIRVLPVGLKGFTVAGVMAILMSTADSALHSGSILLAHDIVKPIANRLEIGINELRVARYATLILGVFGIVVALYCTDIGKLGFYAGSAVGLLYAIPLLAGIMGLRTYSYPFFAAMITTILFFSGVRYYLPDSYMYLAVPIGLAINALSFFIIHIVSYRKFEIIKRLEVSELSLSSADSNSSKRISIPKSIFAYSGSKVARFGAAYLTFGAFFCINYALPYFMWTGGEADHYEKIIYLRFGGALFCGLLIVKEKWPKQLLPYLPTFWHFTLLYCLPFTSTVMFLLTQGSVEWLINVAIIIMFLIVLVDWMSFIILTVLGVTFGFLFYRLAVGPIDMQLDFSTGYLLVYTVTFSVLISLLFARRKEQYFEARLRAIGEAFATVKQFGEYHHPATKRLAHIINQQVYEFVDQYTRIKTAAPEEQAQTTPIDGRYFLQYFFPSAIEIIKQGKRMSQHLVDVLTAEFVAPNLSLLSMQVGVTVILKDYFFFARRRC